MTVNTENIYSGPYVGNDISDTFSYGFRIQDETQLNVYETDDAGNRVLLDLTTDYTVTGVDDDLGGTIVRVAGALPSGYEIFIEADYPATQDTAFASQGRFNPKIHEDALDKLTFLIKQLQYALTNTVQFGPGYTGVSPVLPDPETGDLIRWTDTGIEGLTIGEILAEAGAIISDLDMNSNQIKDIAAATEGTDAVNLTQVTQLLAQAGVDGVVPTVFPTQTGDGTTTTFNTPASGNTGVIASSFFVHVDTAYQTPDVHFSVDVSTGDLTFIAPPPLDSKIYITYFNPIAIENPDNALVTATGTTKLRSLADRLGDDLNVKDDGVLLSPSDSSENIEYIMSTGNTYNIPDGDYTFSQPSSHQANITQSPRSFIPDSIDLLPTEGHPDKGSIGIHRNWSRQFIGKACLGNGKYDGTTISNTGPGWAERDAQLGVSHNTGLIAIFGNSKSSDLPDYHAAPSTMGVGGGIVNDKAGAFGWALYGDVRREEGAGGTFGLELAIKNRGDNVTRRAYTKSYGALGMWLAAGGDPSYQGAPLNPSNVAIAIGRNGHTWNRGIVFDSDGFTGSDGITGTATVMEMAKGHVFLWSTPLNTNGYTFRSEVSDGDQSVNAIARNRSYELTTNTNNVFSRVSYEDGAVNYLELNATPTGVGVKLIAQGTDPDIDVRLESKGSGKLRFGDHSAISGESISGYITIKDSTGTERKLAVVS